MKILIISKTHKVKLDDDDYDKVVQHRWRVQRVYRLMEYVEEIIITNMIIDSKEKVIRLSRLIMHTPPRDFAVKFRDGDHLNMQKENLYMIRFCKEASRKKRKYRKLAKSQGKG